MRYLFKTLILFSGILSLFSLYGREVKKDFSKNLGTYYLRPIFGHLHVAPKKFSASVMTTYCGKPVKISKEIPQSKWGEVEVSNRKGFILKSFLSNKKPLCFQKKYEKFLSSLNLDTTEQYYWARLYDQYILGKSKINKIKVKDEN